MSAPNNFVRSLIRWTVVNGRDALEALVVTGAGALTETTGGGRQLTALAANGKSFSYTIPPGMDAMALLGWMEEALTMFDSMGGEADADGAIAAYLSTRQPTRTIGRSGAAYHPGSYSYRC